MSNYGISMYFRESLGVQDNKSRLYIAIISRLPLKQNIAKEHEMFVCLVMLILRGHNLLVQNYNCYSTSPQSVWCFALVYTVLGVTQGKPEHWLPKTGDSLI